MEPGAALVAALTTRAWTPLFAMVADVVTDVSGPLGYGSIVAREYGIPACWVQVWRPAVYPHVIQNFPPAIRWPPQLLYLGPMLRRYLSSVVGGFEWYVSCGIRGPEVLGCA